MSTSASRRSITTISRAPCPLPVACRPTGGTPEGDVPGLCDRGPVLPARHKRPIVSRPPGRNPERPGRRSILSGRGGRAGSESPAPAPGELGQGVATGAFISEQDRFASLIR